MNQFEMKQLAYQSQLKSRALQVLLYLIDRANKEQTCFPAVSTIGRELHISISTVKRAMRELVEAGYVKKESRFREGNRGQTSNLYTLFFAKDRVEQQKEDEEMYQKKQSVNVSEKQVEKEKQFENIEKCAGESSVYADVTGGGGQNDTTLNSQFNQGLKGEKEVFRKPKLFQALVNAHLFRLIQSARHVYLRVKERILVQCVLEKSRHLSADRDKEIEKPCFQYRFTGFACFRLFRLLGDLQNIIWSTIQY